MPDTCQTCGGQRPGRFCPSCGQPEFRGRHTVRRLATDAVQHVVAEKGAFYTALQLIRRPGDVIHDYVAGRTVRYLHPAAYLLLCAAVFAIIGSFTLGPTGAADSDRLLVLLVIPCIALASRVVFWRGSYNLAEHLILVLYLYGEALLLLTALSLGTVLVPKTFAPTYSAAALLLAAAYVVYGYAFTFRHHRIAAGLGSILAMLAGTAVWLAFLSALVSALRK